MAQNTLNPDTIPAVEFSEPVLFNAAEERTGLSDWGDRAFLKPLRVLLRSLEEEARLNRVGRYANFYSFVRLLGNRLLFEKEKTLLTPGNIESGRRYVFITGLPRTGTTLLQNLLVQDPEAHYLRLCDGLYPFPPPHPATWNDENDPRIEKTKKYVAAINAAAPDLSTIHFLDPTGPEECHWLLAHSFLEPFFALRSRHPGYYRWLLEQSQDGAYAEYHTMLNILGKHFTFQRWVLKTPRHLSALDALLKEFPDACIIWPHRDLTKVIPSLCSLNYALQKMYSDEVDAAEVGDFACSAAMDMFQRASAVREASDPQRFYDVRYGDLIAQPIEEVRKMYEYFGLPYTKAMERGMLDWLNKNPQNKHGKHTYYPEQFSLTAQRIRKDFAEYNERFSVPAES